MKSTLAATVSRLAAASRRAERGPGQAHTACTTLRWERSGVYHLSAQLSLTGNLTVSQREDLLRVAQKCPVHKLMTEARTEISTSLVP